MGDRTFVDRRGGPGNVARSAQTARATEATTTGNSSLGGRRRSSSREPRANCSADCAHTVASRARTSTCAFERAHTQPSLPSNACLMKASSPFSLPPDRNNASDPNLLHRFRVGDGIAVLPRTRAAEVVSSPHIPRKKEMPGTGRGKNFAVSSPTVGFTRCRHRFSGAGARAARRLAPPGGSGTARHGGQSGPEKPCGNAISVLRSLVGKSRGFQRHCDVQGASSCFDIRDIASHRASAVRPSIATLAAPPTLPASRSAICPEQARA